MSLYILSKDSGDGRPGREFVYGCKGDRLAWGGQASELALDECVQLIRESPLSERFILQKVTWLHGD